MAITEYYIDPAINANSGTGTIGDPFGDLQYALDTVTRDATNGDRFNIKAGTAEVLAATLSLATYGTPTAAAPLWFQGYTSAADDGGIGEISGAGSYTIYYNANSSGHPMYFKDMKIGNCGAAQLFVNFYSSNANSRTYFINCEIYGSSALRAIDVGSNTYAINSYFHTMSGQLALNCYSGGSWSGDYRVMGCHFDVAVSGTAVYFTGFAGLLAYNVIRLSNATARAFDYTQSSHWVIGNTVRQSAAGTTTLLAPGSGAFNNLVVGASGVGGIGISPHALGGGNAFYNCTTNGGATGPLVLKPDITLSADPFIDAANGDFEIDPNSDAAGEMYPTVWKGLVNTAGAGEPGAVQSGPGAGGAGIYRRVMRLLGG